MLKRLKEHGYVAAFTVRRQGAQSFVPLLTIHRSQIYSDMSLEEFAKNLTVFDGTPLIEPIGVFPKWPVGGSAELEALSSVRAFRAFARFPWLTVTTDGDLRRVEYRDLAFEDHPFGEPMVLGITVDRSGAVRGIDLGHKLGRWRPCGRGDGG